MNLHRYLLFTMVAGVCTAIGVSAAVPTKQAAAAAKKNAAAAKKAASKNPSASSKAGAKRTKQPVAQAMRRQNSPTPDRYKEIQEALASRGYLTTEPNGIWGAESVDALRRFQMDKKLMPTGRINSSSLIGLGLGSKTAGPLPIDPAPALLPSSVLPAIPPQPQQ